VAFGGVLLAMFVMLSLGHVVESCVIEDRSMLGWEMTRHVLNVDLLFGMLAMFPMFPMLTVLTVPSGLEATDVSASFHV